MDIQKEEMQQIVNSEKFWYVIFLGITSWATLVEIQCLQARKASFFTSFKEHN